MVTATRASRSGHRSTDVIAGVADLVCSESEPLATSTSSRDFEAPITKCGKHSRGLPPGQAVHRVGRVRLVEELGRCFPTALLPLGFRPADHQRRLAVTLRPAAVGRLGVGVPRVGVGADEQRDATCALPAQVVQHGDGRRGVVGVQAAGQIRVGWVTPDGEERDPLLGE